MEDVLKRVEEIVATLFDIPVERVTLDASPATIENWDSMGHLMLVLELEQHFGIELAPEEVEQLVSVHNIVSLLQNKEISTVR